MLTVACVLKSGREYQVEHVVALAEGVRRHLAAPFDMVCLTDQPDAVEIAGVRAIPLRHDWPKWWPKLEMFRPGLFAGPVLYLDLDTAVIAPIDDIATGHRFIVLENFWSSERIGSGLMAWDAGAVDLSPIYRRFCRASDRFIREYITTERWGDQGFIKVHTPIEPDRWQRRHPGRVVSYKRHCLPGVPKGASIVCYHGQPRPWEAAPLRFAEAA